ncbi:hypothetical protein VPG91_00735 [Nitrospirillum amazonense]|uniref:hypothetical protein n=1 Tax=Nitrospirillum amazonense TaxID=28077 RepID=UPI002DD41CDF|nr:hypothetical protein [Nitrospirillum amazonense]MEC4589501.1 hypothetical protein [Nitrospirillum amazonense]
MNKKYLIGAAAAAVLMAGAGAHFLYGKHFPNEPTGFDGIAFGSPIADHVQRLGLEKEDYSSSPEGKVGLVFYKPNNDKIPIDARGDYVRLFAFNGNFIGMHLSRMECGNLLEVYKNKYGKPTKEAVKDGYYSYLWSGSVSIVTGTTHESWCEFTTRYVPAINELRKIHENIEKNS